MLYLMSMPEKNSVWKYSITYVTVKTRVGYSKSPEEDKHNRGNITGYQRKILQGS